MKQHKSVIDIIQLREDAYVNVANIDIIIKTKTDPKDKKTLKNSIYVVYFNNGCRYDWISLSEKEFIEYIKPHINNLNFKQNG